jgi:AP-1 complex subunit gamma-1
VSENKPVGSTSGEADLLGDEASPTNPNPVTTQRNAQDLLADIFSAGSTTTTTQSATQRSTVDDILGLFSTPTPSAPSHPPIADVAPQPSAFSLPQTQAPQTQTSQTQTSQTQPAAPRLTPYLAYDKNELKITLTPQVNPSKPGVVMILARFQVSGLNPATGLNFQAAVPKVRAKLSLLTSNLTVGRRDSVTATANVAHVKSRCASRVCRDPTNESDSTPRRKDILRQRDKMLMIIAGKRPSTVTHFLYIGW